jgi:serine/threonine-protein kinase
MSDQQPWAKNWNFVRALNEGNQGATSVVSGKEDVSQVAVVKELNKNGSTKARRRMFTEVAALRRLGSAKVKVPNVKEDNTAQFEDVSVPLYVVMDCIQGEPLDKEIKRRGKLPLEKAVAITLDLCQTVASAHKEEIIHRDIKPGNIIVRNFENNDLVLVDFGLSFNRESPPEESVSDIGETVGNAFLPLPEAKLHGGDRRDYRSDLTYLCGIFYYCLTGHFPSQFRDAKNRPPT